MRTAKLSTILLGALGAGMVTAVVVAIWQGDVVLGLELGGAVALVVAGAWWGGARG